MTADRAVLFVCLLAPIFVMSAEGEMPESLLIAVQWTALGVFCLGCIVVLLMAYADKPQREETEREVAV